MEPNSLYDQFGQQMESCNNISAKYKLYLESLAFKSDWQSKFAKPMPWIGMYMAIASLFCILAMVADLVHGLRNRKLWFPCKYFTLNAASLTVVAVAMKLPMDLNNLMPGYVDRSAKLGSMAFMCTIMANLLPSLATMDSKELVSNMIALGVLVITLVVNVCIQMSTGILTFNGLVASGVLILNSVYSLQNEDVLIATVYVSMLLMLLMIYACSSLALVNSKQILESKYQTVHETDKQLHQSGRLITVENLKQHVSNYWIMAGTGNPQFMTACSATTSAAGVICALSTLFHIYITIQIIRVLNDYQSDCKYSLLVVFVIQFIGSILGTIAPILRCFAALSFKLSVKWIWNHIKVCKVEPYWTQKLSDWKHSSVPFLSGNRKCKNVVQNLKTLILNICIGFQKIVVVACKVISVVPIFFVICVLYCFRFCKWLKAMFSAPVIVLVQNPDKLGNDRDINTYVLQLQDDLEFPERTLKRILKSVDRLIQKAEKQQPNNLMKLLEKSRGFEGVENVNNDVHVLHMQEHMCNMESPHAAHYLDLVSIRCMLFFSNNSSYVF